MNNGAARVPQDNISFAVFILLPVFLQLNEGVTDFIESAERKSSSLSFVLDAGQFWLFSCQRLLWSTVPDFSLPSKLWPLTLRPDFHQWSSQLFSSSPDSCQLPLLLSSFFFTLLV